MPGDNEEIDKKAKMKVNESEKEAMKEDEHNNHEPFIKIEVIDHMSTFGAFIDRDDNRLHGV